MTSKQITIKQLHQRKNIQVFSPDDLSGDFDKKL